jgi:hypothetical protein
MDRKSVGEELSVKTLVLRILAVMLVLAHSAFAQCQVGTNMGPPYYLNGNNPVAFPRVGWSIQNPATQNGLPLLIMTGAAEFVICGLGGECYEGPGDYTFTTDQKNRIRAGIAAWNAVSGTNQTNSHTIFTEDYIESYWDVYYVQYRSINPGGMAGNDGLAWPIMLYVDQTGDGLYDGQRLLRGIFDMRSTLNGDALQSTVVHEFGHFFAMGNCNTCSGASSVMAISGTSRLTPSDCDIYQVRTVAYPY